MTVQATDVGDRKGAAFAWLGDSGMARRVAEYDWSSTSLGPIGEWPLSLKCAVAVCLGSRFQMAIYWGPELICIYNDAERDILGKLHPDALGLPARKLLHDSWKVVGPQLGAVMRRGEATWSVDRPLRFDRRGSLEIGFFTYSYSPLLNDQGEIGGVLLVSRDTTAQVLAERRIDGLRVLATRSMDATTDREACGLAAQALAGSADAPFVLVYLFDESGGRAMRAASGGISSRAARSRIEVGNGVAGELFRTLLETRPPGLLVDTDVFVDPGCDHGSTPRRAYALPIASGASDPPAGVMVMGLTDDLFFDEPYRSFFEMAAYGVGRSVAAARHRTAERERARSIAAATARAEENARAQRELRQLLNELRAAQRRVVIAADAERRRIERDLHDGAQQRLMAIRLELGLIQEIMENAPQAARAKLDWIRSDVDEALKEMRELAHGLHPPLLASDGLSAALSVAARRAAIPVTILGSEVDRPPRAVETAAYFCCLEALQNAAKHAGPGARATVGLRFNDGVFEFSIRDDGEGFDPEAVRRGQGLTNLRDRLAALGGQAEIISAPGRGTTVVGQIPLS